MPTRRLTPADEGKRVVTEDGEVIGAVVSADEKTVHVRPRPGLLRGCGSWLSCAWPEAGGLRLREGQVTAVTEDRVVVRTDDQDRAATQHRAPW